MPEALLPFVPAYQLDAHGWYVGETVAHASPLEPGVFHLPGGCVFEAPPVAAPGLRARHAGGAWWVEPWTAPVRDPAAVLAAFLRTNPDVAALVAQS